MPPPTKKRRYAADTKIPAKQTRLDIEDLLHKNGATDVEFGSLKSQSVARVAFIIAPVTGGPTRGIRVVLPLPDDETEQELNGRWRALLLLIRSKLVAISEGITELDDAFMADIVLPNGATMRETYGPQIQAAYASGKMPKALPAFDGGS